jgi:spore germination cell wall hydrolase CwlJ-like protein
VAEVTSRASGQEPGFVGILLWLIVLLGLPAAVAFHDSARLRLPGERADPTLRALRPPTPPPAVEPMNFVALDPGEARAFNAKIPFSTLPNPAARPFRFIGPQPALERAVDCLAAAVLYEAGDDPPGQRAVAQVVLNRLRHPAFPKTVCGVVFQGSERTTGCQFTFTCDGAMARIPRPDAWQRARTIAKKALSGSVDKVVGYATHYHTDWVVPYWSASLDKVSAVRTHLFFRWAGWWGTPPAFRRTVSSDEPVIALLGRLSPAHATDGMDAAFPSDPSAVTSLAAAPLRTFGPEMIGKAMGGARIAAMDPGEGAFALSLDRALPPDAYPHLADTFCGGRAQCRILAWVDPAKAADRFPIDTALLPSMAFSYIHDAGTGLRRALWNCRTIPRANPVECMRRDPAPAPAGTPAPASSITIPQPIPLPPAKAEKRGVETVVIKPPGTSPAPAP